MEHGGSSRGTFRKTFTIPINLSEEHMDIPRYFYESKKSSLKNEVQLIDPCGNCVKICVLVGCLGGVLWDVVPTLVRFYGLKKNHDLVFDYEGENRFKIGIFDENKNEFPYPLPVKEEYEEPGPEIVELSSDSEDDEDDVARAEAEAEAGYVQVNGRQYYKFVKVISGSVAKRNQTLPLPRSVVREYLSEHNWGRFVIMKEGDDKRYLCSLLWRKRDGQLTDCHLGEDFYQFVSDYHLVKGDKLHFKANEMNNFLHVRIQRRNGNGNGNGN